MKSPVGSATGRSLNLAGDARRDPRSPLTASGLSGPDRHDTGASPHSWLLRGRHSQRPDRPNDRFQPFDKRECITLKAAAAIESESTYVPLATNIRGPTDRGRYMGSQRGRFSEVRSGSEGAGSFSREAWERSSACPVPSGFSR